jgi:O-antigen biosynthesis protein
LVEHGWREELVSQLLEEGVGAVGAKLLYPDGGVQHAGVVLGMGGVAGHPERLADRLAYGHFGWLQTARSLSAVTAACMAVRRDVFDRLGGFDEAHLGVAFNDVDFCLRIREAGWRVVWTPNAVLMHHESVSRGHDPDVRPRAFGDEVAYMERRWGHVLRADPAYNPNLSLEDSRFSLAFPPRALWWAD